MCLQRMDDSFSDNNATISAYCKRNYDHLAFNNAVHCIYIGINNNTNSICLSVCSALLCADAQMLRNIYLYLCVDVLLMARGLGDESKQLAVDAVLVALLTSPMRN